MEGLSALGRQVAARRRAALALVGLGALVGCEELSAPPPRATPREAGAIAKASASSSAAPPPPAREGCARTGALDFIVKEEACAVTRVPDDAMRASIRSLAISAEAEPPEVFGGGTSLVTVTIENTGKTEVTVYLEMRLHRPGPRTDWSRVSGVPVPVVGAIAAPRLFFPMTTTDAARRDVDALPTLPNSAEKEPEELTALAVHLRPGGRLTHKSSWWAYRIPAPAPSFTNDAGHRYVPKTSAQHLPPGDYTVTTDVPLYGLAKEERKASAQIRVTRPPLPDGGVRRR